ncbi:MAG: 4-vinyl reductase [Methanocellales archaeon]|nr:4-vinyl reductase [Methanocellales archaeon]
MRKNCRVRRGCRDFAHVWSSCWGNIASSFVKLPATKEEVVELDFTFVHHQLGWYNTHQFEFDGEKGKIVIDYSCFAEPILAQKGKQDKPVCYYLVGFFKGFLETVYKTEWDVQETKCIAEGEKHCEFVMKSVGGA